MIEQPLVDFQHSVIADIEGFDGGPLRIFYTSDLPLLQKELNPRSVTIRTFSIDNDQDGLWDILLVNASFPVFPTEQIHRVRLALGAQVSLRKRIRVASEALIYVDIASPLPGKSIYIDGHLQLKQPGLITEGLEYHYLDPVIHFNDFSWTRMISEYHDRDCNLI
jgi:hypothetical protein